MYSIDKLWRPAVAVARRTGRAECANNSRHFLSGKTPQHMQGSLAKNSTKGNGAWTTPPCAVARCTLRTTSQNISVFHRVASERSFSNHPTMQQSKSSFFHTISYSRNETLSPSLRCLSASQTALVNGSSPKHQCGAKRNFAKFKTDYDELYSHGSTGGETMEDARDDFPVSTSSFLLQEDEDEDFDGIGVVGVGVAAIVMDDQDPYKDDYTAENFSYYPSTSKGGRDDDSTTPQEDEYIELEEDVWILHQQDDDDTEEDGTTDDSSIDY